MLECLRIEEGIDTEVKIDVTFWIGRSDFEELNQKLEALIAEYRI
jgi:hypothetical protein